YVHAPDISRRRDIAMLHRLGNIGNLALKGAELVVEKLLIVPNLQCGFHPDAAGLIIKPLAEFTQRFVPRQAGEEMEELHIQPRELPDIAAFCQLLATRAYVAKFLDQLFID